MRKIRVGITIGDPSGIGPHITAIALNKLRGLAEFTVIGDLKQRNLKLGRALPEYGRASIEYLDRALGLIKRGEIDCLVTCPISKEAINLAGYKYSGHTEYFSSKCGVKDPVMMLLNDRLKISLVTRHLPLVKVSPALTEEKIRHTALVTLASLKNLFGIKNPRLVICGLNPHASDNGLLGKEENRIIKPALKKIAAQAARGSVIDGPFSADSAIAKTAKGRYDCAVAMYHDQALIPLKLTSAETGVNITLGLSFIRTSPLHGTAFDLAASGFKGASAESLIAAIKLAVKCASIARRY
ncbi:MAG: 4-hydroxythreonine-4-phosphate dehydrogenase PdxA [Candidatus Omnitrophota bacterium]